MFALFQTIDLALNIYIWLIIGRAIFSWLYAFNVVNTRNNFVAMVGDFLFKVTEPAMRPIRQILPDLGGIDISPIILFVAIYFVEQLIWNVLRPAIV